MFLSCKTAIHTVKQNILFMFVKIQGLLKSFYFHSSPDAVKDMCRKSEVSDSISSGRFSFSCS